jgi:hypothetical protein
MPELLVEKRDHVATLTLNRPERMNAISTTLLSIGGIGGLLSENERHGKPRLGSSALDPAGRVAPVYLLLA